MLKVRSSSFGISGRKCEWKCNMHWFLNKHPILMPLAYLLPCCFNFQFMLNILCKYQTILSKQLLWTEAALHGWHGIDQTIIDNTIDEWRRRLRACVRAKGRHFKQFSHMINVSVFVKCDTIFRLLFWKSPKILTSNFCKAVWQILKVMWKVLYEFCWKCSSLSGSEIIFKIR